VDAYLTALQLMGNKDDALDVAQEALLRLLRTLHRFDRARASAALAEDLRLPARAGGGHVAHV